MLSTLTALARRLDDAVEARQLFQPNARTAAAFDGAVLGHFDSDGPNPWDGYRFVAEPGGTIRVFPGIEVQIAREGPVFRMRARGKVLRVGWLPPDDMAGTDAAAWRETFLARCVTGFSNSHGIGATAFIARTLDSGRRKGSL